jgi:hypothetical protein
VRKNLFFACTLILTASVLSAQAPAPNIIGSSPGLPTFDPTPLVATLGQSSAWNKWADASLTLLGQHLAIDESTITTQAQTITAMQVQMAAIQSQVKALQNPPPPAFIYALSFSTSSSRTPAANLNGALISGSIYIFSAVAANIMNDAPANVQTVDYWLDNPSMSGAPLHSESLMPFDFMGSTGTGSGAAAGNANPWVSTTVTNGPHSITQKITMSAGGIEVDTASFTVAN